MPEILTPENNGKDEFELIAASFSFSGPLPPPGVLAEYERIVPGSAEKVINLTMDQARHRMDLETRVVDSDINDSRMGLIFAFLTGLAGFAAAVLVAKLGYGTASSIIGGGTLVALVGAFIYGLRGKNMEK